MKGKCRNAWLLALLACACGSGEDGTPSGLAARELAFGERSAAASAYTLFEADPVRPIAVLEKSGLVTVTNSVDGYLEILRPTRRSAVPCGAVQVGLQPVAVAVVDEGESSAELWVVNHLSDSVSVITLDTDDCRAEVTRTLPVGHEPRDIVVARDASGRARVFVATAHRGQNRPLESARLGTDLILPPRDKAAAGVTDVLVFDPAAPSAPPAVVNLFSDRPCALAAADGVVYAASFLSGNRTSVMVFVANTDANNLARFEGHGQGSSSTLIGHLHESRITVLDPAPAAGAPVVQPVHRNTHVDYRRCCEKDPVENAKSFAFPTAGVFSADGSRFFFSALGSDKVGSVSTAAIGAGFDQDAARERDDLRDIFLNDSVAAPSGPVGLALDARRGRLYVKTHFDNQLVVIDAERERITGRVFLHDPEPESVSAALCCTTRG